MASQSIKRSIYDFTVKVCFCKLSFLVIFVFTRVEMGLISLCVHCRMLEGINDVELSKYKGKYLLIVNVPLYCSLTDPNYTGLNELYENYKGKDFEILAFPCNQFGGQEPGNNEQILEFACTSVKAEFPIFHKVDVNGKNTAPIYEFLKSSKPGLFGDSIKRNFSKFLVDKEGNVVHRYASTTSPLSIEEDIKKLSGIS
ncbi:hypothetical protein SLE2022_228730 [Rubroshorea leprosula]